MSDESNIVCVTVGTPSKHYEFNGDVVKKEDRTTEDILISIMLRRLLNKLDEERAIKIAIISKRESYVYDTAIEVGWFNSKRCVFV